MGSTWDLLGKPWSPHEFSPENLMPHCAMPVPVAPGLAIWEVPDDPWGASQHLGRLIPTSTESSLSVGLGESIHLLKRVPFSPGTL